MQEPKLDLQDLLARPVQRIREPERVLLRRMPGSHDRLWQTQSSGKKASVCIVETKREQVGRTGKDHAV